MPNQKRNELNVLGESLLNRDVDLAFKAYQAIHQVLLLQMPRSVILSRQNLERTINKLANEEELESSVLPLGGDTDRIVVTRNGLREAAQFTFDLTSSSNVATRARWNAIFKK